MGCPYSHLKVQLTLIANFRYSCCSLSGGLLTTQRSSIAHLPRTIVPNSIMQDNIWSRATASGCHHLSCPSVSLDLSFRPVVVVVKLYDRPDQYGTAD
jgi:hypothetical protein